MLQGETNYVSDIFPNDKHLNSCSESGNGKNIENALIELKLAYQKKKFNLLKEEYDTKINQLTEQVNKLSMRLQEQKENKRHDENCVYKQVIEKLRQAQNENSDSEFLYLDNLLKMANGMKNNDNASVPRKLNRRRPIYND